MPRDNTDKEYDKKPTREELEEKIKELENSKGDKKIAELIALMGKINVKFTDSLDKLSRLIEAINKNTVVS